MKAILKPLVNFLKKEDGPTAVECALLLGLVIVVSVLALHAGKQTVASESTEPMLVSTTSR